MLCGHNRKLPSLVASTFTEKKNLPTLTPANLYRVILKNTNAIVAARTARAHGRACALKPYIEELVPRHAT